LRNKGCVHPHLIRFIPEFAPGSIGCAYTYSGPLSKGRESEHHFWGFPQVILSWSQSVPNTAGIIDSGGKFDTGGKFDAGIIDSGGKFTKMDRNVFLSSQIANPQTLGLNLQSQIHKFLRYASSQISYLHIYLD